MAYYGIVVHGGAGSPASWSDGCKAAAESAFKLLEKGMPAIDAAVEAVRLMEDDERFNAGYGSVLRLDGKTIEMDASVMDSKGKMGAVIAIRNVKNPVLVARAVMDTPHMALAGEGAEIFARKTGLEPYYAVSPHSRERYKKMISRIKSTGLESLNPLWKGRDIEQVWNFNGPFRESAFFDGDLCDTVGAAALDKAGGLAVASSTGGASPMMLGRVGDTPLPGCGFYAGTACAVAATGVGEEIIRLLLARNIYEKVCNGTDLQSACDAGIALFRPEIPVGIIAISGNGIAIASNREMASHAILNKPLI